MNYLRSGSFLLVFVRLNLIEGLSFLVTGANGYIGRAVVHELIELASCTDVVCLVRAHHVTSEEEYWTKFDEHSIVRVLEYDMLDGGKTVKEALETCADDEERCVFHIASVFGPTEDHKQTALDNVKGAEDLVHVLSQGKTRCKLILTSSMAAVRGSGQEPANGKYYTHEDRNTISKLGANWGASYQWSKAESERRAKELCEEYGIPLVVLNPSFVFGPASLRQASSSFSLQIVEQWARGESPVESRLFVDVRDVANAHIAAAIRPEAVGKRYLLSTEARVPSQKIAGWLQKVCLQTGLSDPDKIHFDADFAGGAIPIGEREVEATDRLREDLGIELRSVKDTIMDMARVLLE
jgi:nucleoside-diphosphate-sugar epimerase